MAVSNLDAFVKWWGPTPDSQIVTFPLNKGEDTFVFATLPASGWTEESWTTAGDPDDLRKAYKGFHPEAYALVDACDEVMRSALHVRDPLPHWSKGRASLLGDACHPMTPYRASGAAMALEDAAILGRCLENMSSIEDAFRIYEATRKPRTSAVQAGSSANTWMRNATNPDWLYGYDAWTAPLEA